jgi:hypothetical protein
MISSLSSILPSHISKQIQADRENCLQLEAEKWKKARMKQEKEERGEEEEVAVVRCLLIGRCRTVQSIDRPARYVQVRKVATSSIFWAVRVNLGKEKYT